MDQGFTIPLYSNVGFCRYIHHLGSDLTIVEAARVSYASPSKGANLDKKLLFYLFKNRHTSPFEQCNITFNIRMPIFVMRQFVRHRTFKLNEVSARYTELPDSFFYPDSWRLQDTGNKQGSLPAPENAEWNIENTEDVKDLYQHSYEVYKTLVGRGVANELARVVLPVGIFTEIYVNCDIHNLIHFLRLRQHPHAQKEIRDLADAMFAIMRSFFPWCTEAYLKFKMEMIDLDAT